MKLHWVELENWRQHAKTKIEFDDCTTVIYGQNEAGKSTIFEALSKGFFDRSSSQAESIKRIKPLTASGNVTSTVRIEFTINKTKYRVEKNFNIKSGTSLYKVDGERCVLIDQDTADEKLINLLEAELPSPRGSKPSQWGAFHWLWANQNNRELPDDSDGDPTVVLHLDKKETGMLVTPKFKVIQERIQSDYAKYFTNTGRITKDSPISKLEEDIQNLEKSAIELKDKIKKVDGNKQKLESLESQLPDLLKTLADTKSELEKVRSEAIDLSSLESELKASSASVSESERDVKDAKNALKELSDSARDIDNIRKEEKNARESFSRLDALREHLESQFQEKDNEVEGLADEIRKCEELTRDARILKDSADTLESIDELSGKIERISKINEEIETLRKEEIPIVPTDKEINNLIQKQIQMEVLRDNLKLSGISVSVVYGEEGSFDVDIDDEKLLDGVTIATATESVKVKSPGLGEVTIKAKLDQARDAKSDIINLEKDIQVALEKYGSNSIDGLKEMNLAQKTISDKIKELIAEKRGIDKRSLDEMILERQSLNSKYEGYKKLERKAFVVELNTIVSNLAELVRKREMEEDKTRKVLDGLRKDRENIKEGLSQKREELATIGAKLKYCEGELDKAINFERELIRRYGSEENQEKKLSDARAELKDRKEKHKQIEKRYEELEKGSVNKIKRLELQIDGQENIVRQHRTFIDQLKGAISIESLEGSYSKLSDAESQIEILKERLEKEQIRSESLKLLKESLENQYHKALSVVVGPIQDEVKRYLSYVTGFLHEDVELDEYLFPTRLGERGIEDISLEFSEGSSGLKEMLAICVRLAVAKHLSERDCQCLVLDDPFVHVSSDRSNKMIELINEAISGCGLQVIILTHRQMEFAGLSGKMVDIQSVKVGM